MASPINKFDVVLTRALEQAVTEQEKLKDIEVKVNSLVSQLIVPTKNPADTAKIIIRLQSLQNESLDISEKIKTSLVSVETLYNKTIKETNSTDKEYLDLFKTLEQSIEESIHKMNQLIDVAVHLPTNGNAPTKDLNTAEVAKKIADFKKLVAHPPPTGLDKVQSDLIALLSSLDGNKQFPKGKKDEAISDITKLLEMIQAKKSAPKGNAGSNLFVKLSDSCLKIEMAVNKLSADLKKATFEEYGPSIDQLKQLQKEALAVVENAKQLPKAQYSKADRRSAIPEAFLAQVNARNKMVAQIKAFGERVNARITEAIKTPPPKETPIVIPGPITGFVGQMKDWSKPFQFNDLAKSIGAAYQRSSPANKKMDDAIEKTIIEGLSEAIDKNVIVNNLQDIIGHLKDLQATDFVKKSPVAQEGINALIKKIETKMDNAIRNVQSVIEQFSKTLNNPKRDPQADRKVLKEVQDQWKIIAGLLRPDVKALRPQFASLESRVLAPTIPEAILKKAHLQLDALQKNLNTLKDPSTCQSLQDCIALEIAQNKLRVQYDTFTKTLAADLKEHFKIELHPQSLTYLDPASGKRVNTALTDIFDKADVGLKLSRLMETRSYKQEELIAERYVMKNFGGIGDCLFRSVARVETVSESHKVREKLATFMSENRGRYEPLVQGRLKEYGVAIGAVATYKANFAKLASTTKDKAEKTKLEKLAKDDFLCYLEWMKEDSSYGGEPEIQAYSDMVHLPLIVIQIADQIRRANTVYPQVQHPGEPIPFECWGQAHFVPLFLKPEAAKK